MERLSGRRALFVVAMLAFVCVGHSAEVEEEVATLSEGGAPKAVVVEVSPNAPNVAEPTIKQLLPKHKKILTKNFIANNGGKQPSVRDDIEIERLATLAAAKEINDTTQAKDAYEQAARQAKRLNAQIEHDHKTIFKTEQNLDYAARKQYLRADSDVIQQEKKVNALVDKEEKLKEKRAADDARARSANVDRKFIQKQVNAAKQAYKSVAKKLVAAKEHAENAKQLDRMSRSRVVQKQAEVKKVNKFMDNIEAHEARARLKYRQAKITKEFEEENARKVKHLLSRLTAKRDSIARFTRTLSTKAEADFKTAMAGIAKAKSDYQKAKTEYDKFTKKAGKYQAEYEESVKLVNLAKMSVVNSIDAGNHAAAIRAAEKHKGLKKREKRDLKKVSTEDFKAKGQQHYMNAAISELTKSEALETVARKQKDMVKQHKVTLRAQSAKIQMLQAEVDKHVEAGKAAARTAREFLLKVKVMRSKALEDRNDAQTIERRSENIDVPMAGRLREKADTKLKRVDYRSKNDLDDIATLNNDKVQITIGAQKARKAFRLSKDKFKTLKKKVLKAKSKLDGLKVIRKATLERNKQKMEQIKARVKQAEDHFKQAKGEGEDDSEDGGDDY